MDHPGLEEVFSRVPTECNMVIEGEKVKNVKETVYLGVKLCEDGKMEGEVERKIGITVQAVRAMKRCMRAEKLAEKQK